MGLSRQDIVDGLREGFMVRSYMEPRPTMTLGQMVEYIDMNVNNYAGEIKAKCDAIIGSLVTTSRVTDSLIPVGDLLGWVDWHLNKTVPQGIATATSHWQAIRDGRTGAVYGFRPGERPVFRHIVHMDEYNWLSALRLLPPWESVIKDPAGDLTKLLRRELDAMATNRELLQDVIEPPPPPTYTVAKGDTFSAIAGRLGVSVDELRAANPQVPDINQIDVGQVLTVPTKKG